MTPSRSSKSRNRLELTENQGESLALQRGDESDNPYTIYGSMAREDIPRCVIHTFK